MIIVVDKKEQVANIENYLNTFHIHFYTSHQKTCSIIETLIDTFPFDEKIYMHLKVFFQSILIKKNIYGI